MRNINKLIENKAIKICSVCNERCSIRIRPKQEYVVKKIIPGKSWRGRDHSQYYLTNCKGPYLYLKRKGDISCVKRFVKNRMRIQSNKQFLQVRENDDKTLGLQGLNDSMEIFETKTY